MPEQSSPPCFSISPKPTDNLFLGILPDPTTAAQIASLAQRLREKHGLRGRQLATERFHLTLYAFNPLSVNLQTIAKVAADVADSTPSFEVGFDQVLSVGDRVGNLPCVLQAGGENTAMRKFRRRLGVVLAEHGFRSKGKQGFTPHVTLLYDEQRVAKEPVEPVGWRVNEFVLVHSLVGRSRYISLARWTLLGRTPPSAQKEFPFSTK